MFLFWVMGYPRFMAGNPIAGLDRETARLLTGMVEGEMLQLATY
jgi:hypothetical protein